MVITTGRNSSKRKVTNHINKKGHSHMPLHFQIKCLRQRNKFLCVLIVFIINHQAIFYLWQILSAKREQHPLWIFSYFCNDISLFNAIKCGWIYQCFWLFAWRGWSAQTSLYNRWSSFNNWRIQDLEQGSSKRNITHPSKENDFPARIFLCFI